LKKKRSVLVKSVVTATLATSIFAAANPAQAATVSQAGQDVVKAEKLAGALKWETSLEYRKTKYPNSLVGMPNMKLFNDTKAALAQAKKSVAAIKGKDKEVLTARLDSNVALYVNRSVAYIDAVSSGLKIQKKYNELHAKYVKGEVDDQTEKLYHELSYEIKKNAFMLDRVYGVTTRNEFREYYKRTAENQLTDLLYPVTIKMEIDRADAAIKAGDLETALLHLDRVDAFVQEAAKHGLSANNKLIVSSLSELGAVRESYDKGGGAPTTPPPPPAPVTSPAFSGFAAQLSTGVVSGSNNRVSLAGTPDSSVLQGVQITSSNAAKFRVNSVTVAGLNFLDKSVEYSLSGATSTITSKALFGTFDSGEPGVGIGNMRAFVGDSDIILKGNLIGADGTASDEITININLGK